MQKEEKDEFLFKQLKQLLLEEEHIEQQKIKEEVTHINQEINDLEKLAEYVNPIIQEKLDYVKDHFPELYGELITKAIKKQIVESQDEVIDALYPIIGKLIKKYIIKEFELLSERIDNRMQEAFSFRKFKNKIKHWFSRVEDKDVLLKGMIDPQIEEAFVIEKKSGLLVGSYSRNQTIDQDMIAGMLTAIKSFVEDAFSKKAESLETVEYETYKIVIQNFQTYYIAVVISGSLSSQFKSTLSENLMEFAHKYKLTRFDNINNEIINIVSQQLTEYFEHRKSNK